MTVDNCSKMTNMVYSHESCGNRYYVNQDTNEVHCACGVEADFPHSCKEEPENKSPSNEEEELRNITGALITAAFYGQVESIIDSIESIMEQVKESLERHGLPFQEREKGVLMKSVLRGIEMRMQVGKPFYATEIN